VKRFRIGIVGVVALACVAATAQTLTAPSDPPPAAAPAIGRITLTAEVPQKTIPANRDVPLAVTLSWTGGAQDYRLDRIEPPQLENLSILGSATDAAKEALAGGLRYSNRTTYRLHPDGEGRAAIGPATAYYREAGSDELKMLRSERIELTVGPPARGFLDSGNRAKVLAFAGGLVLLAAVVLGIRALVLRGSKPAGDAPREPTPEEELAAALAETAKALQAGEFGGYYLGIADAVRRFARRSWKMAERAETTGDLLARLAAAGASEETRAAIGEILSACDYGRYTGTIPTHTEASALLAKARALASTSNS
jgi:hypothetical protein